MRHEHSVELKVFSAFTSTNILKEPVILFMLQCFRPINSHHQHIQAAQVTHYSMSSDFLGPS